MQKTKLGIGICQDSFAISWKGKAELFEVSGVGSCDWWKISVKLQEVLRDLALNAAPAPSIEAAVIVPNRLARFSIVGRPSGSLSDEQRHALVKASLKERYGSLEGWAYTFAPLGARGLVSWAVPMDWLWPVCQALRSVGGGVGSVIPAFLAGFQHSEFNIERDGVYAMYESGHVVCASSFDGLSEMKVFAELSWAQLRGTLQVMALGGGDVHLIAPACAPVLISPSVRTWFVDGDKGQAGIYAEWAVHA